MEQKALQAYVDALNSNDPASVAAIFAEDGTFSDGATRLINLPDANGTGPAEIVEIFKGIMGQFHVSSTIVKMNKQSMEYDVTLGEDITLPCVGTVTVNDEGKVVEYIARPR